MTSALDRLAGALSAAGAGQSLTTEDVLDALWLARWITPVERPREIEPAAPAPGAPPATTPLPTTTESTPAAASKVAVARPARAAAPWSKDTGGSTIDIHLASPPALAGKAAIAGAVRRALRKVAVLDTTSLDEPATVLSRARDGLLSPVYRRRYRPRFRLSLVIDRGGAMEIWGAVGADLGRALRASRAFRDVRIWEMDTDAPTPVLRPILSRGVGLPRPHRTLADPTGRRLILVFTDCSGRAWHEGGAPRALSQWAKHGPVALIHALPEEMWSRTALGRAVGLRVRARMPFSSNGALAAEPIDSLFRGKARPGDMPFPVLALTDTALHGYGRFLSGGADDWYGVRWTKASFRADRAARTPEQRLRRFKGFASPVTRQLASHLAAVAPLTLPVIRLVREALVPGAKHVHEAELLLSGLLVPQAGVSGTGGAMVYDLDPELRRELLDELTATEAVKTMLRVWDYIEAHGGSGFDIHAVLADPKGVRIDRSKGAFASAAADVFLRIGGEYAEAAAPSVDERPVAVEGRSGGVALFEGGSGGTGPIPTVETEPVEPPPVAAAARVSPWEQTRILTVGLNPFDERLAATLFELTDVLVVAHGARADLTVSQSSNGDWGLHDDTGGPDRWRFLDLAVVPPSRVDALSALVRHYHVYSRPFRFAVACGDLPEALDFEILDARTLAGEAEAGPSLIPIRHGPSGAIELVAGRDKVCFSVGNRADVPLKVAIINCSSTGRVQLFGEAVIAPQDLHLFWHDEDRPEPFEINLAGGDREMLERMVVIGTTALDVSMEPLRSDDSFADFLDGATWARAFSIPEPFAGVELASALWTKAGAFVHIAAPEDEERSGDGSPADRILALHRAAISCGLSSSRDALLTGIDGAVVARLVEVGSPAELIVSDLQQLEAIGRVADDAIPLVTWLANAEALAGPRPEASLFREARTSIPHHEGLDSQPRPGASLGHEDILSLHRAAIEAGLSAEREALLAGVRQTVIDSLPSAATPSAQLLLDLDRLNRIGRLLDGSEPLVNWLSNAASLAAGRVEELVFQRMQERVLEKRNASAEQIVVLVASRETSTWRSSSRYAAMLRTLGDPESGGRLSLRDAQITQEEELVRALRDHRPQIVHFHVPDSNAARGIVLIRPDRRPDPELDPADIAALLGAHDSVRVVVLDGCLVLKQAQAITKQVDAVVGFGDGVSDAGAMRFFKAFYGALGSGHSLQQAWQLGITELPNRGATLVTRAGVDAAELRLLPPAEPPAEDA